MTLCAGGFGKDICKGDSGGPLTLSDSTNTHVFLVGITSLGPDECGKVATQAMYSSLVYYINWIVSAMRP